MGADRRGRRRPPAAGSFLSVAGVGCKLGTTMAFTASKSFFFSGFYLSTFDTFIGAVVILSLLIISVC